MKKKIHKLNTCRELVKIFSIQSLNSPNWKPPQKFIWLNLWWEREPQRVCLAPGPVTNCKCNKCNNKCAILYWEDTTKKLSTNWDLCGWEQPRWPGGTASWAWVSRARLQQQRQTGSWAASTGISGRDRDLIIPLLLVLVRPHMKGCVLFWSL